jgi:hypothetical protein
VAAAALAVDVPHAVLSYGPPDRQPCQSSGCNKAQPRVLATGRPGSIHLVHPQTSSSPATGQRSPASPRSAAALVSYKVLRQTKQGFVAQMTLPSQAEHGNWSLSFSFPSAQVSRVIGAKWQPSRNGDGGTAYGDGAQQSGQQGRHARGGESIMIFGTGNPYTPTGCTFNGAGCSFR